MDVHEDIKLDVEKEPQELPKWIKPIQIGQRLFLFKWTFAGWKQLTTEEELEIKLRYGT